MMQFHNVLVLSPHPEDGELGCGGTIQRLMAAGANCWYAAFTIAEKSTHPPFEPDAQRTEMMRSTGVLGYAPDKVLVENWEVRTFAAHRQEILDHMIELRQKIRPDLVFCHSREDVHQDHQTITNEAVRAFKQSSILGYELPWNSFRFPTDYFVELDEAQVAAKCDALSSYQSRSYRPYLDGARLRQWMGTRGLQIEADWAEAFEVIRLADRLTPLSQR